MSKQAGTWALLRRQRSWPNLMTFGLLARPDVPPPLAIVRLKEEPPGAGA